MDALVLLNGYLLLARTNENLIVLYYILMCHSYMPIFFMSVSFLLLINYKITLFMIWCVFPMPNSWKVCQLYQVHCKHIKAKVSKLQAMLMLLHWFQLKNILSFLPVQNFELRQSSCLFSSFLHLQKWPQNI